MKSSTNFPTDVDLRTDLCGSFEAWFEPVTIVASSLSIKGELRSLKARQS
jgi:hypothetical protein